MIGSRDWKILSFPLQFTARSQTRKTTELITRTGDKTLKH